MALTPEEMQEIIKDTFEELGSRTYVGMRYVPLMMGEWDDSIEYEPLSVVYYNGYSYTSRCFVPVGVAITDTDFWAMTGDYSIIPDDWVDARNLKSDSVTMPKLAATVKQGFVRMFDTVADMQSTTDLLAGMTCHTNGFHSAGDGGAAWYTITETGTANGMDVLELQDGNLFANLVMVQNFITPEMLGSTGLGQVDETIIFARALALSDTIVGSNSYMVSDLNITGKRLELHQTVNSSFKANNTAEQPSYLTVDYADVITLGTFKNSVFKLGYSRTINIAPDNSFAYCKLEWEMCQTLNIGTSGTSYWVNENSFNGRVTTGGIHFKGTYQHNTNKFSCSGEGAGFVIDSENAVHDNIIELYGEHVEPSNIDFATGSYNNVIQFKYSSYINSARNTLFNSIGGGFYSKPTSIDLLKTLYIDHLTNVDQSTGVAINDYTDYENYLIEVAENETIFIQFNSDAKIFRNGAYAYDSDMQPVDIRNFFTNPTQDICNQWSVDTNTPSYIRNTTTQQANYVSIPYREGIKYWRFNVYKYYGSDTLRFADVKIYSTGFMSRASKLDTSV